MTRIIWKWIKERVSLTTFRKERELIGVNFEEWCPKDILEYLGCKLLVIPVYLP
jgi:hypothetical protein